MDVRVKAANAVGLRGRSVDVVIAARKRQATGVFFSGLIYGHQLAATVGKYVLDLEVACQVLDPDNMVSRIEYPPRPRPCPGI
jgi:hypothetical protein